MPLLQSDPGVSGSLTRQFLTSRIREPIFRYETRNAVNTSER